MSESRVEIPEGSGNFYRYQYNPDTQATEYLGPIGDAPAIDEVEFLRGLKKEEFYWRHGNQEKWDFYQTVNRTRGRVMDNIMEKKAKGIEPTRDEWELIDALQKVSYHLPHVRVDVSAPNYPTHPYPNGDLRAAEKLNRSKVQTMLKHTNLVGEVKLHQSKSSWEVTANAKSREHLDTLAMESVSKGYWVTEPRKNGWDTWDIFIWIPPELS